MKKYYKSCTLVSKVLTILITLVTISGFFSILSKTFIQSKIPVSNLTFQQYVLMAKCFVYSFEGSMAFVKRVFVCTFKNAAKL